MIDYILYMWYTRGTQTLPYQAPPTSISFWLVTPFANPQTILQIKKNINFQNVFLYFYILKTCPLCLSQLHASSRSNYITGTNQVYTDWCVVMSKFQLVHSGTTRILGIEQSWQFMFCTVQDKWLSHVFSLWSTKKQLLGQIWAKLCHFKYTVFIMIILLANMCGQFFFFFTVPSLETIHAIIQLNFGNSCTNNCISLNFTNSIYNSLRSRKCSILNSSELS